MTRALAFALAFALAWLGVPLTFWFAFILLMREVFATVAA